MSASTAMPSRRSLLAAAGVTAGAAALGASTALAADAPAFDETYDVVVIGYGLAGAMTALSAVEAGAAKVLLVDAAPQGEEGGNSRFAAQAVLNTRDPEMMFEHQMAVAEGFDVDEDVLRAYCEGMEVSNLTKNFATLGVTEPVFWDEYFANTPEDQQNSGMKSLYEINTPEYPEYVGGESVNIATIHDGVSDAALYMAAQTAVEANEAITVWLESPATKLVQDPETKTITGVVVEHEGAETTIGANSGVVLCCGGFECNPEMIQTYLGFPNLVPKGGLYNKGDGIRMAQEVGADLWHMSNYEIFGIFGGYVPKTEVGKRYPMTVLYASAGSIIGVDEDGLRFAREGEWWSRHGHVRRDGGWHMANTSFAPFMVFDEAQKALLEEGGQISDEAWADTISASSVEELAEKMGVPAENLAGTIERYNGYAEAGFDPEQQRDPATMKPLDLSGTIYANPLSPSVLNTQGGPRRNAKSQVVDVNGEPIPHLYSVGECGGITTHLYEGGGNLSECIAFGRIAGTNVVELA